jgi:8-oxo-dGTP diphosphatase
MRQAARVILLDESDHVLMFEVLESGTGLRFWVMPGGGLCEGETFEEAAAREASEETGLSIVLGPWVWTRDHCYSWNAEPLAQHERFFVARTQRAVLTPSNADREVIGHRWWSAQEIADSLEEFAPRQLAKLLPPILRGEYPAPAIDCGV